MSESLTQRTIMKPDQLEARLASMEKQLADIRALLEERLEPKKDWRSTYGMFAGDEVAKRIDDTARKLREADRKRTKPKAPKRRPARASA